eukprot:Gb_06002 [translate_table: standard]
MEHMGCLCRAVTADGHVEDKCIKIANRSTKLPWTRRSISVPKGCSGETDTSQSPVSPQCSSLRVSRIPQKFYDFCFVEKETEYCTKDNKNKSILSKPLESTWEEGGFDIINSAVSPHLIPLEKVPIEVSNSKGLVRSQSVSELTDSYGCFLNLAEKASIKQPGSPVVTASVKGSFSCTGNSAADKFSRRYHSARMVAERLVRALPVNSKSFLTKASSSETNKLFGWEAVTEDEDRVGVATEVSVSASELANPHSCCTGEESFSSKLFDDSPPGSQRLRSEDHKSVNESISGCFDSASQTGRIGRALVNLRRKQEDRERLNMWFEGYEKITDADEELERRAREAEEQAELLLKEIELARPYGNATTEKGGSKKTDTNVELLQLKVKKLSEEKRNLALEVASEIRKRMSERSAANEAVKLIKGEIECHVKMVEKEKNKLQLSLENELDRRSSEWGNKLEKIKFEEKKLRDRVRDLAEQNVALQREISYLNNKENNLKSQVRESEHYMDGLKTRIKEAENEITQLRQCLTESCKQAKQVEDDRQSIKREYTMKERENYALQKSIVRLQRLCKDQERTIIGLWQGLNDEINDIPHEKNDHIVKLQQELLRVTGAEQALCKDLINCRFETDALRQENRNLLERLKSREEGSGFGLIKLDQELWARLDGLQAQALLLVEENSLLCSKVLEIFKKDVYCSHNVIGANEGEEPESGLGIEQKRNAVFEHEMNAQRLRRKADSLKKSLQMVKGILKEKTFIACNEALSQDTDRTEAWHLEVQSLEAKEQFSELQQELKAETLLSRLLREKICSREVEIEQLQGEVAALIRSQQVLKSEIVRLQDLFIRANHKERDLELQLRAKEETISCLEGDLQRCLKELTVLREELTKVSKERDTVGQQAEQLGREAMRLNAEVEEFQRKVEKLDEDVMLKDGQLSILRESLDNFDFTEKP